MCCILDEMEGFSLGLSSKLLAEVMLVGPVIVQPITLLFFQPFQNWFWPKLVPVNLSENYEGWKVKNLMVLLVSWLQEKINSGWNGIFVLCCLLPQNL